MPYTKIHVHLVWSTKNRIKFLHTKEIRPKVWEHIKENAEYKGIYIDHVNGYSDHCHCLVSLRIDQTVAKVVQMIKGESSFWINKNNICDLRFEWQTEYYAVSVSESGLENVRKYIRNQEQHHFNHTFTDECDEFDEHYGFDKMKSE